MAEENKIKRDNISQNRDNEKPQKENCPKNDKKRGWSHIIDTVNYSSGPGDNIYVFG